MTADAAQLSLLEGLFAAVDARDTDRFGRFLTDDAVFRFGSAPPVTGRAAICEAVGAFYATIRELRHELINTLASGDVLACEGEVTYMRHDGSEITLPFTNVFELDGERFAGYRIYIDIAPLYAE